MEIVLGCALLLYFPMSVIYTKVKLSLVVKTKKNCLFTSYANRRRKKIKNIFLTLQAIIIYLHGKSLDIAN
uniref:Uncharacterized protein n=1 Tax=Rhizophora mucronata TaxID=61149 RepID=A0A2P2IN12_RHIMU